MKLLNILNKLDLTYTQRMGKLMQKKRSNLTTRINDRCICVLDNITTILISYHTYDNLCYQISQCNCC